jgi:hypothetical protein
MRREGQATGVWQDIENLFSPVLCCAPIQAGPGAGAGAAAPMPAGRLRGMLRPAPLAAGQTAEKTARLLQLIDTKPTGGQINAERDGVWFVEGCRNDGTFFAFPNWGLDVLVRDCAGLLAQTTVVLSQPCRMLAISKCSDVKVLCDAASDEILVVDCTNVEVVVGHDAPKIGVSCSTGVKIVCSSTRNTPPLIETRQSTGVSCQCAMTRPGAESASEVRARVGLGRLARHASASAASDSANGAGVEVPKVQCATYRRKQRSAGEHASHTAQICLSSRGPANLAGQHHLVWGRTVLSYGFNTECMATHRLLRCAGPRGNSGP